jgi:hypothetical protein
MTDIATFVLSLSILFPFITGIIRWRTIRPKYYPLMILFCLGLISEIFTRYAIATNTIAWTTSNNLYVLMESLLIPFQFMVWGYMTKKRVIFYALLALLLFGWIFEYLVLGSIDRLQPYFRMTYSLAIVLLSINMLNYLVINEEKNLARHPAFIICTGFIIFFTYQLVYEGIYHIVSDPGNINTRILNTAFAIINGCCNILYGIALVLVPTGHGIQWLDEKTTATARS